MLILYHLFEGAHHFGVVAEVVAEVVVAILVNEDVGRDTVEIEHFVRQVAPLGIIYTVVQSFDSGNHFGIGVDGRLYAVVVYAYDYGVYQGSSKAGYKIEHQKAFRSPIVFQYVAKHP